MLDGWRERETESLHECHMGFRFVWCTIKNRTSTMCFVRVYNLEQQQQEEVGGVGFGGVRHKITSTDDDYNNIL